MKEQSRGPFGRATAVAEGVAAAVRRRQREREPRVVLHRAPGDPHMLPPGGKGHDEILELAGRMIELVDEAEGTGRSWRQVREDPEPD